MPNSKNWFGTTCFITSYLKLSFDVAHFMEKVGDPCCNKCVKLEWYQKVKYF